MKKPPMIKGGVEDVSSLLKKLFKASPPAEGEDLLRVIKGRVPSEDFIYIREAYLFAGDPKSKPINRADLPPHLEFLKKTKGSLFINDGFQYGDKGEPLESPFALLLAVGVKGWQMLQEIEKEQERG